MNINNIKPGDRIRAVRRDRNHHLPNSYEVTVSRVANEAIEGEFGSDAYGKTRGTFYASLYTFEPFEVAPSPEEVNMNNLVTLANLIDKPVFVKIEGKIRAFGMLVESKLKAGSPMHPPVVVAVVKIGGTQQLVDFALGGIHTVTEAS